MHKIFAQEGSIICQLLNNPAKIYQGGLTFFQCGKILPNHVTQNQIMVLFYLELSIKLLLFWPKDLFTQSEFSVVECGLI